MVKVMVGILLVAMTGVQNMTFAGELPTSGRDSAPFFIVKDGKASGICPDIYVALERMDPELRIRGSEKLLSLSLNERALETGANAINCGLGKSPHRDPFVRYVELITTTNMVIAVRKDDPIKSIRDLSELAQLSIKDPVIVRRATVFADRLKARGVNVDDSSADIADNLRKLLASRGRFYYNIDYLIAEQLRDPDIAAKVRVLPTAFERQSVFIVVSSKAPASLDQRISAAFSQLKKSGELDTIFKKYGLTGAR